MLAFNNSYRNATGAFAAHMARGATRAEATVRLVDARYHYPTDGSGQVVDSNAVRDEGRTIVGASVTRDLGSRVVARLALASSDFDGRSTDDPDSPLDTTGFSHDHARVARRGGDARVSVRLAPAALLTTGVAFEDQRVTDRGESQYMRFPASTTRFREHRTDRAAYAELLGDGASRMSYALGARLDDNSTYGAFGTARLATAVRIGASTRLHAAFGTAFREPAFDEAFSTSYTIGNRALEPERTRSWEAGIDQRVLSDRIELGARWFDPRFRDLIQSVSGGAVVNYLATYGNLAAANASGIELEARLPRYGWLDARTSLTLLRTRVSEAGTGAFGAFEAGERHLRRPARQGALEIGIHAPAGIVARASLQLTGERDDYDFTNGRRVTLDAYERLDLGGEYRLARMPLALTVRVDNVTGARYQPVLNFPAPGRVALFGLRVGR
jgi:outer membrane cobalamin receptor